MVRYELSRSGTLQFYLQSSHHITLQALLPRGTSSCTHHTHTHNSLGRNQSRLFLCYRLRLRSHFHHLHHLHHPHNTHTANLPLSNHATNHSHSHHHHHYHARPNPIITIIIFIFRKRKISPRAPPTHQTTQHPPTQPHHHNSLEPLRPQKRRRLVPPTSNPTPHRRQSPLYQSSRGTRRDQSI